MITKLCFCLISIFLFCANVRASVADSTLSYLLDTAQFRINDSLSLAEFYFGVPRAALTFVAEDSVLRADFEWRIEVFDGDKLLMSDAWKSTSYANSKNEILPGQTLLSQKSLQMKAGQYTIKTALRDLRGTGQAEKEQPLRIEPFDSGSLALSDIQMASDVKREKGRSRFHKNGYRVIPNPSEMCLEERPLLMVYFEIYNLSQPADTTYSVKYWVSNSSGEIVKTLPEKARKIAGPSLVEVSGINTISLPAGAYVLHVEVRDNQSGALASRQRNFFVHRSSATPAASASVLPADLAKQALRNYYESLTEKEIDEEFDAAKWIADTEELKIYQQLNSEQKKEFLARYWVRRDLRPDTIENEFRQDYLRRVRYAANNFGGLRPGWQTERGRVLLKYGAPDQIERFPSSNNLRDYEIWYYYDLEGGVNFYFVPLSRFGDMEMVHSTARNEIKDPDWRRWLKPTR